jgi:hypothetical protein
VLTVKEKYIDAPYIKHNDGDRVSDSGLVIRTHKLPHPSDIYRRFKSTRQDLPTADCRLPIADSSTPRILLSLRRFLHETGRLLSIRNPQSAIRNRKTLDLRDLILSFSSLPDKYNGWLIPAVAAGLRAIKRTRAGVIYSSAPYFTSHLAGYCLSLLTGAPWVAHFRDPWITGALETLRPDNKICFRIDRALERMAISRADAVICVTEEHATLMRAAYDRKAGDRTAASKFAVVMNGFDGLEWQEAVESLRQDTPGAADGPRKFRITYAGELYMKRNPAPLFRALRFLIDRGEIGRNEAIVELIGSCKSSEGRSIADIISEAGVEECVVTPGRLGHSETLRRLLQSDLLLLLAEELVVQIPGKTFEYLKTRRPILALTGEGAVATLLRRTGGAWVVNPNDQPGVINAVRECYRLWKYGLPAPAPDQMIVESFDRRKTTGRIAELLDFLVSSKSA